MVQLFDMVRDKFAATVPPAPSPPGFAAKLPPLEGKPRLRIVQDADAVPVGEAVHGLTVILQYVDAEGVETVRQVSCSRIVNSGGVTYLRSFCHARRAPRSFMIARIAGVFDAVTGEELGTGPGYFETYLGARVAGAAGEWGLTADQRAELGAGLCVLTFLSRCDGDLHPEEIAEIETFAAGWWMRAEIAAPFPEADVAARARRLAPDIEAFEMAARQVRFARRVLRPMVAGYARRLIEADGRIAPEEQDWIRMLIGWWDEI